MPNLQLPKTKLIEENGIGRLPDFHAADSLADGTLGRVLPSLEGKQIEAHAL